MLKFIALIVLIAATLFALFMAVVVYASPQPAGPNWKTFANALAFVAAVGWMCWVAFVADW
jgi:ABC-type transport system involved in cytochrome bd biosynthesis fused ATPase/permease subunit